MTSIIDNNIIKKNFLIKRPIDPIVIGRIGSPYGVYGWLKVFSFTECVGNIFNYQPWFIKNKDIWKSIEIENWKKNTNYFIVKINYFNDREVASLLTNSEIVIDSEQLPKLSNGEYYWKDLIGCKVITENNYQLGEVINLIQTKCIDILIVRSIIKDIFNGKERLIPFCDKKVILDINLIFHIIQVKWDPSF